MEQQNTEQNQNAASQITLKSIFSGDILGHKFLKKQANLLILIVMLTILYIDNRYNSQQELIEIDRLKKELINAKYDALSVQAHDAVFHLKTAKSCFLLQPLHSICAIL